MQINQIKDNKKLMCHQVIMMGSGLKGRQKMRYEMHTVYLNATKACHDVTD